MWTSIATMETGMKKSLKATLRPRARETTSRRAIGERYVLLGCQFEAHAFAPLPQDDRKTFTADSNSWANSRSHRLNASSSASRSAALSR